MRVLFIFVFLLFNAINIYAVELKENSVGQSSEIENDKIFILEAIETGERKIYKVRDNPDGWDWISYNVLVIPYNLILSDASEVRLDVTWASSTLAPGAGLFVNRSSLNTMIDTFYLEAGDQIIFSKPSKGSATSKGASLVHFTIYREGALVDIYQGWLSKG